MSPRGRRWRGEAVGEAGAVQEAENESDDPSMADGEACFAPPRPDGLGPEEQDFAAFNGRPGECSHSRASPQRECDAHHSDIQSFKLRLARGRA